MEELRVFYTTVSPARRARIDRFQLLSASFCLLIGFSEALKEFSGLLFLIPIFGLIAAIFNVIIVLNYSKLKSKFGEKVEILFLKANGVIMLITGIGFHSSGSIRMQYIYYLLALLYFILLPYFLIPAVMKKYIIRFRSSAIIFEKSVFKPVQYSWQEIESIIVDKMGLKLKKLGKKRIRKVYFQRTINDQYSDIIHRLNEIKKKNQYSFEIR